MSSQPLTWVVTGCSSGIGEALVRAILAQVSTHPTNLFLTLVPITVTDQRVIRATKSLPLLAPATMSAVPTVFRPSKKPEPQWSSST